MAYRVVCKEHGVTLSVSRKGSRQSYWSVHCPCPLAHDTYQNNNQIELLDYLGSNNPQPKPKRAYK